MRLSMTIPESFLELRGAKDMKNGARGWFPASALRIDRAGRGWIHPEAEPADPKADLRYDPVANGPIFSFERATDAEGRPEFQIALQRHFLGKHRWEALATPRPAETRGLDWIPVRFVLPC
jgi:hypothetical protein